MLDGPFAETKEQLLGLWIIDADSDEEALETAKKLAGHKATGSLEVRPLRYLAAQRKWHDRYRLVDAALTSARPQAVAALLRYFRDLDRPRKHFRKPACAR